MTLRHPARLAGLFLLVPLLCLGVGDPPRRDFPGDSSPGGRYSLRVVPAGTPSPGGPYVLLLYDKVGGAEHELLRFPVHVDVHWRRNDEWLAVSDFGDGHRGNAFLFDLRPTPKGNPIDLGARLAAEKPETSGLLQQKNVIVEVQGWSADLNWTIYVHGHGPDQPRGFQRWYYFDPASGFSGGARGPRSLGLKGERDYDTPEFEGWKHILLDRSRRAETRINALREVMMHDARRGLVVVAGLLRDPQESVRNRAAEWLAIRGDRRGLEVMRNWLSEPRWATQAAQRLGNSGRQEYAQPIAEKIRRILYPSAPRGWNAESRAFLRNGTIALARLGRPEDRGLIFEVARIDDSRGNFPVTALGFVDDPRSRTLLWETLEKLSKLPGSARTSVDALLALSRLRDPVAIEKFKQILRDREGWWPPGLSPMLTSAREAAFQALRPRDAATFAETVFEIAAQDPEGPGTREAWEALGVMHPAGFGRRVVKLAWSRRPHWITVSRSLLNEVVIAIESGLNSVFWSGLEAEQVSAMHGKKTLVREGLGGLMFRSSWSWIGE